MQNDISHSGLGDPSAKGHVRTEALPGMHILVPGRLIAPYTSKRYEPGVCRRKKTEAIDRYEWVRRDRAIGCSTAVQTNTEQSYNECWDCSQGEVNDGV